MYQAFELIYPTLQSFRKGANNASQALPAPSVPTHQVCSRGPRVHGFRIEIWGMGAQAPLVGLLLTA